MLRRLVSILSALSLAFCIAICVLWVRSYYAVDAVDCRCIDAAVEENSSDWWTKGVEIGSSRGVLAFNHFSLVWAQNWPTTRQPAGNWQWRLKIGRDDISVIPADGRQFRFTGYQPTQAERLGFGAWSYQAMTTWNDDESQMHPEHEIGATAPDWLLAALAAILPVLWVISVRRRFPTGHCQHCGYDLRATRERCPECGKIPG
jgi:hypothetical protein